MLRIARQISGSALDAAHEVLSEFEECSTMTILALVQIPLKRFTKYNAFAYAASPRCGCELAIQ